MADPGVAPDLLYLFDAAAEAALVDMAHGHSQPDRGAFVRSDPASKEIPFQSTYTLQPGRYRRGVRAMAVSQTAVLVAPCHGILPLDEFTLTVWLTLHISGAAFFKPERAGYFFAIGSGGGAVKEALEFGQYYTDGMPYVALETPQREGRVGVRMVKWPNGTPPRMGERFCFCITLRRDGRLTLSLNGTPVGVSETALGPVKRGASIASGPFSGLFLLAGLIKPTLPDVTLSDLAIYRYSRETSPTAPPNVLTINPAKKTGFTYPAAHMGALGVVTGKAARTFRALNTLPDGRKIVPYQRLTKALMGAPARRAVDGPQGAIRNRGASGRFFYDWTLIDRTLAGVYAAGQIPHIGLDGFPPVLTGIGSYPTLSGPRDENGVKPENPESCQYLGYGQKLPKDRNGVWSQTIQQDWQALVRDVCTHITEWCRANGQDYKRIEWGGWNEPDDRLTYFEGTRTQLFEANKLLSDATYAVTGKRAWALDISRFETSWIDDFIAWSKVHNATFHGVCWHEYTNFTPGNAIGQAAYYRRKCKELGYTPATDLGSTESAWNAHLALFADYAPEKGQHRYNNPRNLSSNDFGGASLIGVLLAEARSGFTLHTRTNLFGWDQPGYSYSQSFTYWSKDDPQTIQHGPVSNALRLLALAADKPEVTAKWEGVPGVDWYVSKDERTGDLFVLLSRCSYKLTGEKTVALHLPPAYAGRPVTYWVMDYAHGNPFNPATAPTAPTRLGVLSRTGTITFHARERSAHLLVIPGR